jgi:hypothetical protein
MRQAEDEESGSLELVRTVVLVSTSPATSPFKQSSYSALSSSFLVRPKCRGVSNGISENKNQSNLYNLIFENFAVDYEENI